MQKNRNHSEIGEKRFLWRQMTQSSDINNEIFQKTSLRIVSRRKNETENIGEKIEAKKKELLQNQANHEELLAELSRQNRNTQKIATLVLRGIKNEFLKNITNKDNKSSNGFHDENITRSTIENLWKDLQKNLDVIQCKNLAKEVSQMLQTMQHNEESFTKNSMMSATLQKVTQLFSEEADNTRWKKAEDDWKQQKKELAKVFSAQKLGNKKLKSENALESFLENLDELSPDDRWKIANKILKTKNISPNNLNELADYIASVDKDLARKIDSKELFNFNEEKNIDETKKSWWSKLTPRLSVVLIWLLLLFLALVVCFLIFQNFVKVENL
ncbi:hypothetical protein KAI54_01475 [Candidatus Gracilibacteria bacterium]|nr:hypothetical protein [Candidatus Gracilibacteria bacterium]